MYGIKKIAIASRTIIISVMPIFRLVEKFKASSSFFID